MINEENILPDMKVIRNIVNPSDDPKKLKLNWKIYEYKSDDEIPDWKEESKNPRIIKLIEEYINFLNNRKTGLKTIKEHEEEVFQDSRYRIQLPIGHPLKSSYSNKEYKFENHVKCGNCDLELKDEGNYLLSSPAQMDVKCECGFKSRFFCYC